MVKRTTALGLAGWMLAASGLGRAEPAELTEADFLAERPPVLTASRLEQSLMDAPNSITVIDRKLIEASGYHNLSDLFRLVPGRYVGQFLGWFHTVNRSLVQAYARHMQVLIDGNSVYQPSFGGVRWDALPLGLDDIERIEVVRGNDAATYGANAFTGVINIITRHPEDVGGRLLRTVTGDHDHREAWFRWAGGGEAGAHRVTLGRREDGGLTYKFDDERSNVLNYRGDFRFSGGSALTLGLGALEGSRGLGGAGIIQNQPHDQDVDSYSFQAQFSRPVGEGSELLAKVAFDNLSTRERVPVLPYPLLKIPAGSFYPIDLLSRRYHGEVQVNQDHGGGVRSSLGGYVRRDSVRSAYYYGDDDVLDVHAWGAFAHGEFRLAPAWLLNLGTFYEHHDLANPEWSPRATLHWQPSPAHSLRLGLSRAYRNPVMFEAAADWRLRLLKQDGSLLTFPPPYDQYAAYIHSTGSISPEVMRSQEIGYLGRWPEAGLDVDLRLYREHIDGFISAECTNQKDKKKCNGVLPAASRDFYNIGGTRQQGLDAQVRWQPRAATQLILNYAVVDIDSDIDENRYTPAQQYGLHVLQRLPGKIDMTLSQYWVPAFKPMFEGSHAVLPAFKRLDARLARSFKLGGNAAEVALVWQNLTGKEYLEFSDSTPDNLFDSRAYLHLKLEF